MIKRISQFLGETFTFLPSWLTDCSETQTGEFSYLNPFDPGYGRVGLIKYFLFGLKTTTTCTFQYSMVSFNTTLNVNFYRSTK